MYSMTAFILFSDNLPYLILLIGNLLGSILFICILHVPVHACISLLVIDYLTAYILFSGNLTVCIIF